METLSLHALRILRERYLLRSNDGDRMESPEQLVRRVAKAIAKAELEWGGHEVADRWEGVFAKLMSGLYFLPNSPTLMNAGTPQGQLSACFVLPVEDSLSSIYDSLKMAAKVHQKGGGTGFNFSKLRPTGDSLGRGGGKASGPVSFIRLFDFSTEQVKQGGKRRGANMGVLNVDHPDIFEFVQLRTNGKPLQNFNLSVGVTDAFMQAVEKDKAWELIHPRTGKAVKQVQAKVLWQAIVESAWESGNPGMIFLDTINAFQPLPSQGRIWSTNPCGEVPLLPFESCNLGSVNLSRLVRTGEQGQMEVDWEKLAYVVRAGIRFLDNVIEVNRYPHPHIAKSSRASRKVGLGVMGWAELLILLGIPYASDQAVDLAEKLMEFVKEKSRDASRELARERGTFSLWENSVFYPDLPLRNATLTSIAPTGTISILADTTSSIEPLFALAFHRKGVLEGGSMVSDVHPLFLKAVSGKGLDENHILQEVRKSGSCMGLGEVPSELKELFRTALEISPEWHLRHQLAFQKHTDNAVSKTVNLPSSATVDDIANIYREAWEQKAKGITVFRNASNIDKVLHTGLGAACKPAG